MNHDWHVQPIPALRSILIMIATPVGPFEVLLDLKNTDLMIETLKTSKEACEKAIKEGVA